MSSLLTFNFPWLEKCRLCLSDTAEHELFTGHNNEHLSVKISKFLNLLVYQGDPMPTRLCSVCKSKLDSWEAFTVVCNKTQNTLKEQLVSFQSLDVVKEFLEKAGCFNDLPENSSRTENGELTSVSEEIANIVSETIATIVSVSVKQEPRDGTEPSNEDHDPIIVDNDAIEFAASVSSGDLGASHSQNSEPDPEISHIDEVGTDQPVETLCKDPATEHPAVKTVLSIEPLATSCADSIAEHPTETGSQSIEPTGTSCDDLPAEHTTERGAQSVEPAATFVGPSDITSVTAMGATSGIITSVEGNAAALWQTENEDSMQWSGEVSIKEEQMSPEVDVEYDDESDSRSYDLRPRTESLREDRTGVRIGVTPWKCSACQVHFKSSNSMKVHMESPNCLGRNIEHFNCRICLKRFYSDFDLAYHGKNHLKIVYNATSDDLRNCSKCDSSFIDPYRLKEHVKTHQIKRRELPAAVPVPPAPAYKFRSSIPNVKPPANIVPKSEEQRDFQCSLCPNVRVKTEDQLYDHRFARHGIPDERVSCSICFEKFRTTAALAEHIQVHKTKAVARKSTQPHIAVPSEKQVSGVKVRCRRCGALFESNELLARHEMLKHKNATPYWCRRCRCRFATRSLLLIHHRTHIGADDGEDLSDQQPGESIATPPSTEIIQGDLRCQPCRIVFKSESDFLQHKSCHDRVDEGTFQFRHTPGVYLHFQCDGCPQLFHAKSSLRRHSTVRHGGQLVSFLPLKCSITYPASPVENNKHDSAQSVAKMECKHCPSIFSSQAALNFHCKKTHGMIIIEDFVKPLFTPPNSDSLLESKPGSSQNLLSSPSVKCPFCLKLFASTYINKHIKKQHPDQIQKGPKTKKTRKSPRRIHSLVNLRRHEASHRTYPQDYVCHCGKGFAFDKHWEYVAHQEVCRPIKKEPGKEIATKTHIPSEMAAEFPIHRTPISRPPVCPHCHKAYETQSLLDLHIMTAHAYEEINVVKVEKQLELWREMGNKIVREVGNGVICCTLCGIKFDNVDSASYHRSLHPRGNLYVVQIGDSLYQCTICDKVLSQRDVALSHANLHVQVNMRATSSQGPVGSTYDCPYCKSKFGSSDSLKGHIFYIHSGASGP